MNRRFKNSIPPLLIVVPLIIIGVVYYWPKEIESFLPIDRSEMKKLNVLIWKSYIPEDETKDLRDQTYYIYDQFAREQNIDVVVHYFDTNKELLERLRESRGKDKYDIVMPSNFLVNQLAQENLIQKIPQNSLSNYSNIDSRILDDASKQELLNYSVPYIFGVGGLVYNGWEIAEIPLNWGFLFNPSNNLPGSMKENLNTALIGKLSLINDMRTSLGTAMIYLDEDPGKVPEEVRVNNAADLLIESIEGLKIRFQKSDVVEALLNGSTNLAMAWSGDAMLAMLDSSIAREQMEKDLIAQLKKGETLFEEVTRNEIPKIRFTCPRPNALAFFDCFAIVANTSKAAEAAQFIDFLLTPTIAAQITNYSAYANTVPASRAFIDRDILNGPAYFLPDDESVQLLGKLPPESVPIYNEAWKRVMAVYNEAYPREVESAVAQSSALEE